jgi:hypothetical protein
VENNPLFDRWHPKYKKQLSMSLRKESHSFESFIVKQGTMIDGLRFILRYYIMNTRISVIAYQLNQNQDNHIPVTPEPR